MYRKGHNDKSSGKLGRIKVESVAEFVVCGEVMESVRSGTETLKRTMSVRGAGMDSGFAISRPTLCHCLLTKASKACLKVDAVSPRRE